MKNERVISFVIVCIEKQVLAGKVILSYKMATNFTLSLYFGLIFCINKINV